MRYIDNTQPGESRKARSPYDRQYCLVCGEELAGPMHATLDLIVYPPNGHGGVDWLWFREVNDSTYYLCSSECLRELRFMPLCELMPGMPS